MKNILFALLFLPFLAWSEDKPVSMGKVEGARDFNPRASHWVLNFGADYMQYEVPYSFNGQKRRFKEEKRELSGLRMGFGREQHLGGGVLFALRGDAYYLGSFLGQTKVARDPDDVDVKISEEGDSGYAVGGEGVAHLGKMFDFQTKNPFLGEMNYFALEPFAEAGLGVGSAKNQKRYWYKLDAVDESYKASFSDTYGTASVGGGFNLISVNSGFYLNVKASLVTQKITERKSVIDGVTTKDKDVDTQSMMVYTLGGGYKF